MAVSRKLILSMAIALAAASAMAVEPINKTLITKLAVNGYDQVAYFTDGKSIAGSKDFEYRWMNATWRFATTAHRAAFAKNPQEYVPQYVGYCAYGVGDKHAVGSDPEAWKIVEGKLYLNYNKKVQQMWLADVQGFIKKVDQNWPKLISKQWL